MNINDLSQKDIGALLYVYYLENELEDDFSFDDGSTREKVEKHYNKLGLENEEIDEIFNKIVVSDQEGTNYDWLKIFYLDRPELFLQVTSMIDYDGESVDGYTGDASWADVGMFFVDYKDTDFDDLDDNK